MGQPPVPPQPDDTIAFLTIRLHANGQMTLNGHVADKKLILDMLAQARDVLTRQLPDPEAPIIVPNRDVDLHPAIQLTEFGDIPASQRGDP